MSEPRQPPKELRKFAEWTPDAGLRFFDPREQAEYERYQRRNFWQGVGCLIVEAALVAAVLILAVVTWIVITS